MDEYRVQVNTFGDPKDSWAGNAIKHKTCADAETAARDLFGRWTAVESWRVIDANGAVHATGP